MGLEPLYRLDWKDSYSYSEIERVPSHLDTRRLVGTFVGANEGLRHDDLRLETDLYAYLPLCSFAHACDGRSLQAGTSEIAIAIHTRRAGLGAEVDCRGQDSYHANADSTGPSFGVSNRDKWVFPGVQPHKPPTVIKSLKFSSNKRSFATFGCGESDAIAASRFHFKVMENKACGLFGRSDYDYLHAIGVHFRAMPKNCPKNSDTSFKRVILWNRNRKAAPRSLTSSAFHFAPGPSITPFS
uniref:Jacalin-type lectin domain-containing protein n=1 Tax=Ananas comosus var. bracteatus TaxID=296719 RepID=A0A6V7PAT1_ANACO|nr:unnamed protein product [Ananas comosus var. bracteatus]